MTSWRARASARRIPGIFRPVTTTKKGAFTSYRPRMWMGVRVSSLPWVALKDKEQTLSIRSTG